MKPDDTEAEGLDLKQMFLEGASQLGVEPSRLAAFFDRMRQAIEHITSNGDFYAKEEKDILEKRDRMVKELGALMVQNVLGQRAFFLALTTFSLTIAGLVLPLIASGKDQMFKSPGYLYVGLAALGVCAFTSVWYMLNRLGMENRSIATHLEFQRTATEQVHDFIVESHKSGRDINEYLSKKEVMVSKFREGEKARMAVVRARSVRVDHWPKVIGYSFLSGIVLVALSLFA